jgi:Domain of unknown function (DUF6531)
MRALRLLAVLFSVSLGSTAQAFDPEIQWKVVGQNPPTFPTKSAAVGHMQSLDEVDERYPLLTVERRIYQISETSEIYEYTAPEEEPVPTPWTYQNVSAGGPSFSSVEELIAYLISISSSAPECPDPTWTPTSSWVASLLGYGGMPTTENRIYTSDHYRYMTPQGQPAYCELQTGNSTFRRTRSTPCPSGYFGEQEQPGCYLPFNARIEGRRLSNECPNGDSGNRGNPCNALTGDKAEAIVDYRGPHGLEFVRYYHSRSSDDTHGLGVGWSHNYQSELAQVNGASVPSGIVAASGSRVLRTT